MAIFKNTDTDMTQGPIFRQLLIFSLPLLVGNLLQQLYNTVDSIITGIYIGKDALAAIGCTTPVTNMLIGFFLGFSSGAGVIISQYFGARLYTALKKAVQTAVFLTLLLGAALSLLGIALSRFLLTTMQTPDDIIPQALRYLQIYFMGLPSLLIYNIGSGILRAVGDSKRPLLFLLFSSLSNIALDLLLVAVLRLGIAGAAIATVIAQTLSAALVLWTLTKEAKPYAIVWRGLALDRQSLRQIWSLGIPTALQLTISSISSVFVQSYINYFGTDCMAGWTSYSRLDSLVLLPIFSFSMAATTFVGQNLGVQQIDRAMHGTRTALRLSFLSTLVLLIPLMLATPGLVALFNPDTEVVRYGSFFVRLISPSYFFVCVNQVIAGVLRGAGDARHSLLFSLGTSVVLRQIYLFFAFRTFKSVLSVALGFPLAWFFCAIISLLYYRNGKWQTYAPVHSSQPRSEKR